MYVYIFTYYIYIYIYIIYYITYLFINFECIFININAILDARLERLSGIQWSRVQISLRPTFYSYFKEFVNA